ncbi:PRD domain-containing protein [Caproiciproducens sp. CPB-2]|uniref:PRD domain-containing protein n=1 Tax=unclassified Caproiciproducens TaxID=2643836 RepID=UPI0023D9C117|nr:PRD domain-containing protein [Caproiciproducens sp. CPB-2]MDF1494312.1 PRD domain-containing protein [Caproiciproducens sp. CPB-2]
MQIRKVLNSSVVLVADNAGEESILLGKGIGYDRKAGEEIARQPSDRVFIPLSNPDAQPMLKLFSTIPSVYLELTQEIVADAEKTLNEKLSSHIYLMLTDHMHFAVERQQKGLIVTNRVFWEIKHFYRKEFDVGVRGLQRTKELLNVELPEEEAGNIAFHIVNARKDIGAGFDAMQAARLIRDLANIVTYSIHYQGDTDSINYSRFISHLQFFAERFFSAKLMDSKDDFLYQQMQKAYPEAMACAEKTRTYVLRNYNVFLPNEEVAYLALHVARLVDTSEKHELTEQPGEG